MRRAKWESTCNRPQISFSVVSIMSIVLCVYYVAVHGKLLENSFIGSQWSWLKGNSKYCTFKRLKEYHAQFVSFPSSGVWVDGPPAYFKPAVCEVQYARIPDDRLAECLAKGNISRIVTLGDSNAALYFASLNRFLTSLTHKQCTIVKREDLLDDGFLPDLHYYVNNTNASWADNLQVQNRQCRGCASVKRSCHFQYNGQTVDITIEQAAMTATVEDSLRVVDPGSPGGIFSEAPTSQEFWLRYYLSQHYPDLLLIFLPFSHDKQSSKLIQVKADVTYFHSLVKAHVPNTTQVIYFPSFSEFEHARKHIMYVNRTYGGLLAAEKVRKMNNILLEVLFKDIVNLDSNIHGFLDLFTVSLARGFWSTDGIHMQEVWYDAVMSIFWQVLCKSLNAG